MIYYKLKCKDLGFDSCEYTFIGNSENELKRKFFLHTMMNHEKDFELMTEENKIKIHYTISHLLESQNY